MITRPNKQNTNRLALVSRGFLVTALAAAALNSAANAQTNSSSGINRRSAEQAAQAPASTSKTTAAPATAASKTARTKATAKRTARTAKTRRTRQTSSVRSVKITIHGDRYDVRQARQQGVQSLQNANAAVAAREAQRVADAEANANNQAAANANNNYQQTGNTAGYGYVPGYNEFGNPIASYGAGAYGSVSTIQPVQSGGTPYGSPNVTFPSFYTNYSPGIYSTYSSFGSMYGSGSYRGF